MLIEHGYMQYVANTVTPVSILLLQVYYIYDHNFSSVLNAHSIYIV